jgi:hypothetical protein
MRNACHRIIMAMKMLDWLRDKILEQDGRYTGQETPNIQSVLEILSMSDKQFDALDLKEYPEFISTAHDMHSLRIAWDGV